MGEILFTNVFSNIKKSLNFKGYIFILLFIGLFLLLPNYAIKSETVKIGILFYSVLFSMISAWVFIFKRKINLNKDNILKFIINNVLLAGSLICAKTFFNVLNFEENLFLFIISAFSNTLIDLFLFFMAISGILTLIGKEKIAFIESGKIFKNSFGKFFTILFFLLFYELYNSQCINVIFLIFFSTKNEFRIYQLIISKIIEIFFSSYIFYFFLTFVSDVFKNYLEKSENNFAPNIFKNTITVLKERKLKFFGTIVGIYILFGIAMTTIIYIFITKTPNFFSYYHRPNMSIILGTIITIIIILGVLLASQILVVKTCFKALGESTEKINFSKIMKIVGYGAVILMLAIIIHSTLTYIPSYLLDKMYKLPTLHYGATYFIAFYFGYVYYMIIGYILNGQKVDTKKVFKFLPWKFVPVFLGVYKLNGQILDSFKDLKEIYFSDFNLLYFGQFLINIAILFVIFIFSHTIILAGINYIIESKDKKIL